MLKETLEITSIASDLGTAIAPHIGMWRLSLALLVLGLALLVLGLLVYPRNALVPEIRDNSRTKMSKTDLRLAAQQPDASREPARSATSAPAIAPPILGIKAYQLRDSFNEIHHGHRHEAIDIMAPAGTPVRAVVNGTIEKLFLSKAGGNTIYEFDDKARTVTTTRIWNAMPTGCMRGCVFPGGSSLDMSGRPATLLRLLRTCTSRSM